MRLAFTPDAWEDHKYWQDNDRKKLKKPIDRPFVAPDTRKP